MPATFRCYQLKRSKDARKRCINLMSPKYSVIVAENKGFSSRNYLRLFLVDLGLFLPFFARPRAIALGSKPPLVTRIARTGLGTRLVTQYACNKQASWPFNVKHSVAKKYLLRQSLEWYMHCVVLVTFAREPRKEKKPLFKQTHMVTFHIITSLGVVAGGISRGFAAGDGSAVKSHSTTLQRLRRQISHDYYTIPPATQARKNPSSSFVVDGNRLPGNP